VIDTFDHDALGGDRFLLCTDGLFREVSDDDIVTAMTATNDLGATADALIELAVSRGGRDNVAIVVAEISA
jgi:serine/threonine protein phosphatase PrpC